MRQSKRPDPGSRRWGGGATHVTDLYLSISPAADFTQDSIEMYFEMLAGEDELFAGARLHFTLVPVAATCLSCGEEFQTEAPQPVCPVCGGQQVAHDPRAVMLQLTDIGVDDA